MATTKMINSIIRSVGDFNLLGMNKRWSGQVTDQIKSKFNRLKLEYARSRTDQQMRNKEDGFNTLRVSI